MTNIAQAIPNAKTQRATLLQLLIEARGNWVPLTRILELRISQYSARIHELRHEFKFPIENRTEIVDGQKHSWFRLQIAPQGSLFGDITPVKNRTYLE